MNYIDTVINGRPWGSDPIGPGEEIIVHVGGFAWAGEYIRHTQSTLVLRTYKSRYKKVGRPTLERLATDHFINVAHIVGIMKGQP